MEKNLKITQELWIELMTIKLNEGYSSIDAVIKDKLIKTREDK